MLGIRVAGTRFDCAAFGLERVCGNDDRVRAHPNSVTRLGDDLADHRAAARPYSVGGTAAFRRSVDDGSAQAFRRTQDVRAAERSRSLR
jgi:hypothetical protein